MLFVADIIDKDSICSRYYGKGYFLWQILWIKIFGEDTICVRILWTKILFVADIIAKDTICVRYYGQRYYLCQILWTKLLFVSDIMDKGTCDISWTKIVFVKGFYLKY